MNTSNSYAEQRESRRKLRAQLDQEFPEYDLDKWYIQYRELKAACPDAILLYRLGDFYETFDDDAKLIADMLGVTLTHREFANFKGKKSKDKPRCPMAGMPYHAIERYVAQLVAAGYRIAVAEQTSATASSKSDTRPRSVFASGLEQTTQRKDIVDREIVRIITPGTVIDSGMLTATQNNYLVALLADDGKVGLAYADLSTGEFACTEFSGERAALLAQGELARLQAAEVLVAEVPHLRLLGLEPASAKLDFDLEFMTKDERDLMLPGERVARRVERENSARWAHGHITAQPAWRWELRTAREALYQQLRVQSLAGFGLSDKPLATRAAGVIIQYIIETQHGAAGQITSLNYYTIGGHMFLDPQTRRNLELLEGSSGGSKGSLVAVLDQTRTPMGARLLRRWISQPLLDLERLNARHDAVEHCTNNTLMRAELRTLLRQIGDVERAVNRVIQGVTIATPRDMVRLREALRALPGIMQALDGWMPNDTRFVRPESLEASELEASNNRSRSLREKRESRRKPVARHSDDLFGEDLFEQPADLFSLLEEPKAFEAPSVVMAAAPQGFDQCADILAYLEATLDDDPPALLGASNYLHVPSDEDDRPHRVIRPGHEPMMDAVVQASYEAQQWISELEVQERERTGIRSLKVDFNKVFGYYIEVPKSYADEINQSSPHYVRKQTLASGERYITPKLKEYEDIVLRAKERLNELEQQAFSRICDTVAAQGPRLLATARALAEIDVYTTLAEVAIHNRYTRPQMFEDTRLNIVAGRHPVVEQSLDVEFIANDTRLDTEGEALLLVTGPNMAGKSTTLRQVALIVLMAQIGSFVPADSAEIGLVDRIFTRIGAQDDIATGQSTFMVEMTETAALLLQSTRRSLIILDEVGRGTSTYDGMAIARAIVEYIHNEPRLGCRTLFATHYHELTALEQILPHIKNYHMAALEQDDRVVFLHELRPGKADRSYGIHVAELAGIPRPVIRRAKQLLAELEQQAVTPHILQTAPPPVAAEPSVQAAPSSTHAVVKALRDLNINELSPIEALTKLYELQQAAKQG
jgi:DNA mismatch repair protein MutS